MEYVEVQKPQVLGLPAQLHGSTCFLIIYRAMARISDSEEFYTDDVESANCQFVLADIYLFKSMIPKCVTHVKRAAQSLKVHATTLRDFQSSTE